MWVTTATGLAAMFLTSATGLWLLAAMERRSEEDMNWLGEADSGTGSVQHNHASHRRWKPLDLEPYKVPWPSEVAREPSSLPAMSWPSEHWNDPHFGRNRTTQVPTVASTTPRPTPANPVADKAESAAEPRQAPKPTPRPRTPRAARPRQQAPFQRPGVQAPRPNAQPKPRPQQQSGLPESEALRQMVQQRGLAEAVQHIRDQTGWDFQDAARYVAKTLAGRSKGG